MNSTGSAASRESLSLVWVGIPEEANVEAGKFSLHVEHNRHGALAKVTGDLDIASAPQLRELFQQHAGQTVTLDLSGVTFMDSTAMGVLIAAHRRAEQHGGHIAIQGVQRPQMRLFELMGLTEVIDVDNEGAAAAS